MRLLYDGQALQGPTSKGRGIGRYANNLLCALRNARPDWQISVVEAGYLPPIDRDGLPDGLEFTRLELPLLPPHVRANRWMNDRAYGDWLAEQPVDAFLSAHSFEYEGVHPLHGGRRPPTFVVLYDLIPQCFDDVYLLDGVYRDFYTDRLRQTCEADVLLAISSWSARDYQELHPAGPAQVVAIGGAPDPRIQPLDPDSLRSIEADLRARYRLDRQFILNPSGQCWRKNSRGALEAFARLPEELRSQYEFVVACKINRAEEMELHRLAQQFGLENSLRVTGFVDDLELRALYQLCRACFFPSFYEGLGLPVVEALQCGAPVITSDCSSLPEFAGPYSFLCDPADVGSMTGALEKALAEPRLARQAERMDFSRNFRWEDVAERAAEAIEEQTSSERPWAPVQRPRLAWVTTAWPGSPEMERVEDLIGELMRQFAVEIVVPDDHPGISAASNCQMPLIRSSELRDRNRVCPFTYFLYDCSSLSAVPFLAGLARTYPGLLLDDAGAETVQRVRWWNGLGKYSANEGFVARAVSSPGRWAELRPLVDGPLYLIGAPSFATAPIYSSGGAQQLVGAGTMPGRRAAPSSPAAAASEVEFSTTTIVAARLAAALESLASQPPLSHARAA